MKSELRNLTKEEIVIYCMKKAGIAVLEKKNTDLNKKMLVEFNGEIYEVTDNMVLISQTTGKKYGFNLLNLNAPLVELKKTKKHVEDKNNTF